MRALILVLDSVGIGGAPDAAQYGDEGADTIGHITTACANGTADNAERAGPLTVPNLVRLGLAEACRLAGGRKPPGLDGEIAIAGQFGCACEVSRGKDTPSGHWELAGVPVPFDWGYFPRTRPCFPPTLISELCERAGLPGILGNCHASGIQIIAALGEEHIATRRPICYTSADSVFQVAAHEEIFGLDELNRVCEIARGLVTPLNIGRVIARPFVGSSNHFRRTANRRDYAVSPPSPTLLDIATAAKRDVVTVGKIADIFAYSGTGRVLKADGIGPLFDRMLEGVASLSDGGLLFANFVDFDSIFGHRRDTAGYANALEDFDRRLPVLLARLHDDDLLVITADHGCDPTWPGTDHTREQVPILSWCGAAASGPIGRRTTFADVGATVASYLDLPPLNSGTPFLNAEDGGPEFRP
jgi:phosphopentomutase